jgi:phosphopantothenoylcysteine decarboxylase/phosphopantothenate--cysteine ligase
MAMAHIELRKNTDLLVIAPASAEFISQAACGSAGTLLSTLMLSYGGEKIIAPSMNPTMFKSGVVGDNLKKLSEYGIKIISPENGEALCGDSGEGKMASVDQIVTEIIKYKIK